MESIKRYLDTLRSASFTCQGTVNMDLFEKLVEPQGPYEMRFNTCTENIRKHHKTRINKKWAKRYGVRTYQDVYNVKEMKPTKVGDIESYDVTVEYARTEVF